MTFTNPVGAITQAQANSGWNGRDLVEGPPFDIRGFDFRCYHFDPSVFGNWVFQGWLKVAADSSYTWHDEPAGTVSPSGIGAQLLFTGVWDIPGNAYIAIPDSDGDPRLIMALAAGDQIVHWYCS